MVETLHLSFERLVGMPPIGHGRFPRPMPMRGVYLFSEGDRHLYVGRSDNLRRRYGHHSNPGSQHNQAVFAFKLAREATGQVAAAYAPGANSRVGLAADEAFREVFRQAKSRIRRMDYRFVVEEDPTRQALLELYCAIALGCPYNDFANH